MSRVIYEKNPLIEVILQIQFPTNLIISNQEPTDFQVAIKNDFPNYRAEIKNEKEISLLPSNNEIKPLIRDKNINIHTFITKEGYSKISLSNSTISMSTLKYERWEMFIEQFKKTLEAFIKIYSPQYIERIGLRYIDAFKREDARARIRVNIRRLLIKYNYPPVKREGAVEQVIRQAELKYANN